MSSPTNGFPDCAVGIEPLAESFRPYDHQQAAWDAMDRHFTEKGKHAGILVVSRRVAERQRSPHDGCCSTTSDRAGAWSGSLTAAVCSCRRLTRSETPRTSQHHRKRLRLVAVSGQDRDWSGVSAKPRHCIFDDTVGRRTQGYDFPRSSGASVT